METYTNANLRALIARMPLKVYLQVDQLGLIKVEKGSILKEMATFDGHALAYNVEVSFAHMELYIYEVLSPIEE